MSFAGLKKQFNKANQFLSEKVGGTQGSQLEEDFKELERKTDVIAFVVENVQTKTKEYLQPNPAARTKLSFQATYQKARGQAKDIKYPQPECNLADVMLKGGQDMNDDGPYAESLVEIGQAFTQLGEIKDALEHRAKQNFLDPLFHLQNKDIKEIMHHRKKLEGRRLDYDYKKKKGEKVAKEELRAAEDKFEESKELCYSSMMNLMDSDVENVGHLHEFAEALRDYHRECTQVLEGLVTALDEKMSEAASRPRAERRVFTPKHTEDNISDSGSDHISFHSPASASPQHQHISMPISRPAEVPSCKGLYDFEPENEGELGFKEGDIITLTGQIDENWYEGTINGMSGFFPVNYVEIIVPL